MNWGREDELIATLRGAELGWWIGTDTEIRLSEVLREAERVTETIRTAFPVQYGTVDTSWTLKDRLIDERDALKPFIQTLAQPMTTPMRAMVLALMFGASVTSLHVEYRRKAVARLQVTVEITQTGESATFESNELWDFEVLRHFGLMKAGERPVIDGYYAFRKEA